MCPFVVECEHTGKAAVSRDVHRCETRPNSPSVITRCKNLFSAPLPSPLWNFVIAALSALLCSALLLLYFTEQAPNWEVEKIIAWAPTCELEKLKSVLVCSKNQ